MIKYLVPLVAIVAIMILEMIALLLGMNGTMFGLSLTFIGGLAGYEIKALRG